MNTQKNIFLMALIGLCLSFSACTKKASETIEKAKDAATDTLEKTKDAAVDGIDKAKEVSKEAAKKAEATINIKKKENKKMDPNNTWNIKLKTGVVKINLRPDLAPKHVERIKTLTKQGFYNGLKFHRVIDGFMAQTGDPKGNGTGGSSLPDLESEFTSTPFKRGVLGMARSASPHSANSQFFIMFADGDFLNNKYTVFGEVTSGMEHVDALKKGNSAANGAVTDPDTMLEVTLGN